MDMKDTYDTGLNGEKTAELWLCREKGMVCLERRYRTKYGEIDLILLDQDTIVFAEVKTRRSGNATDGLMAVNAAKQKRITHAATVYLMRNGLMNRAIRFDVIEVFHQEVIYVSDAFQPGGFYCR